MFVEIQNGNGMANDAFIVTVKRVLKRDVRGLEDRLMDMHSLEDISSMGFKVGGLGRQVELDAGIENSAVRAVLVSAMSDNRLVVEEAEDGYAILRRGHLVNEYKFMAKYGGGIEDMSDRNGLYFLPESRWNETLMYKVEMSDGSAEYMSEQEYINFKDSVI